MEVLQGNLSDSKHSRRRLDRITLGENRALDWGHQDSDIDLLPLTPLALAEVLSQQDGFLDLLAWRATDPACADNDADNPTTGDAEKFAVKPTDKTKVSSNSRNLPSAHGLNEAADLATEEATYRTDQAHNERCNLQTHHDTAELLRRCKRILVENALIKDKGDRQLYLAAGFISWPDVSNSNARVKAPLLLYPVLLVRVPNQQRYEIRLTGNAPEYNQALLLHAEQRFAIKLPAHDSLQPLEVFYEQVAEVIKELPTLQLELETALGSAALFHASQQNTRGIDLPDIPENFNVGLAMSITGKKSLSQLNAVLQLIPDYSQFEVITDAESTPKSPAASVASLRKYAARLAAEGLDHVEFRQLESLPSLIGKWTTSVAAALDSESVKQVLRLPQLTARQLIRLAGIIELIDKAPSTIEQLGHSDLCYSNSTILLRRAQHQAKLIADELAALQEHFLLDKVPSKSQLLSLMAELGESVERGPELVDANYFNARRQFMEFSTRKPANLTIEHRRLLSQLAKVMRFRELFVNNTEYRAALGPAYKGLRTEWDQLNQISDYARELAEVLESETIASQIMRNWSAFRAVYSVELDVLIPAAEACRRLLGAVGTRWQSQSAASLIVHAQLIASRLTEWHSTYGPVNNHADKTPAIVLSSFSGRSRDDMVVETQVDETRSRINKQLQSGEIRLEQITDTLTWLLAASQTAAEHEMDIDAIVEHLQIA